MGKKTNLYLSCLKKKKYRVIHVDVSSIVGHWSELRGESPKPLETEEKILESRNLCQGTLGRRCSWVRQKTRREERLRGQRVKHGERCSVVSRVACRWESQWERGSTCSLAWEGQTAAFAEAHWGHLLWAASYTWGIVYKNLPYIYLCHARRKNRVW